MVIVNNLSEMIDWLASDSGTVQVTISFHNDEPLVITGPVSMVRSQLERLDETLKIQNIHGVHLSHSPHANP